MTTRTITVEIPVELAERLEKAGILENSTRIADLLEAELHREEAPDMEAELQPFLELRKRQYPHLPAENQRYLAIADLLLAQRDNPEWEND